MATKTPRIQVTLSEDAYRVVARMAKLQGSNRSRIIAEVINDLAPVMEDLLGTLEAASRIREENLKGVRDASYEALERMQAVVDDATNQFSLMDLLVRRAAEPPTSNTGVTDTPKSLKSHKSTPPKRRVAK